MDKTMLEERKEELKLVSTDICNLLHALSFMHPMSPILKKELNNEIFIKPNPKLYPHVFHYLFVILDPDEFKKRFYWPILDKLMENHFRSATVEYLNVIKEKYKLNIEEVKRYLVVMPGGVKFLTVLHRLTVLVMKEEMRKKCWKQDNYRMVTDNTLDEALQRKKICVQTANEYKSALGQLNNELIQQTEFINNKINSYFNKKYLSINENNLLLNKWQHENKTIYKIITKSSDNLHKIIKLIEDFVNALGNYLDRNNNLLIKYDKGLIKKTLNKLNINELTILHDNGKIDIINLLKLHENILPNILLKIKYYNKPNLNHDLYVLNSMSPSIDKTINDIIIMKNLYSERKRIQLINKTKYHNNDSLIHNNNNNNNNNNNKYLAKIIHTPKIFYKKDLTENNTKLRLFQQNDINRKFINPLDLLNTIKKEKKQRNTSIIIKDFENFKLSPSVKQLNEKIKNNFLYNENLIDNVLSLPNTTQINNFLSPEHNQFIKKSLNFFEQSPSGRLDLSSFDDYRKINDSFSNFNTIEKNIDSNLLNFDEKNDIVIEDADKTTLFDVSDSVLKDVIE